MRGTLTYLVHPARLTALGLLGALALTVLMLAGRPEAPPEAEAVSTASVMLSSNAPGATGVTMTVTYVLDIPIPAGSTGNAELFVSNQGAGLTNWPTDGGASVTGPTPLTHVGGTTSASFRVGAGNTIAAGTYTATIPGLTNPAAGTYTLRVNAQDFGPDVIAIDTTVMLTIVAPAPSLTIEKTVVGADVSTSFAATAPASPTSFMLTNGGSQPLGLTTNDDTSTVTETVPAGYNLIDISCALAGGGATSASMVTIGASGGFDSGDTSVMVTVMGDEDVVCTFTNEEIPPATLVVQKVANGGDDTFNFDGSSALFGVAPADANGDFSIMTNAGMGGEVFMLPITSRTTFNVVEVLPPGWTLDSLNCTTTGTLNPGQDVGNPLQANISIDPGDTTTCTWTNTKILPGIINIVKNTVGGDAKFDFTTTIPDNTSGSLSEPTSGAFSLTTSGMTAMETFTIPVSAGGDPFIVTEGLPPAGWAFTGLMCNVDQNTSGNASGAPGGSQALIMVGQGDIVTCTFENTKTSSITIVKDADPDRTTDFTFSASGGLTPSPFSLDDDADGTLSNMQVFNDVAAGTYTFTETNIQGNYVLSNIACTSPGGSTFDYQGTAVANPIFEPGDDAAEVTLAVGDDVVCTFTNVPRQVGLTIVKDAVPDQATDFTFTRSASLGGGTFLLDDDADGTLSNTFAMSGFNNGLTYTVQETAVSVGALTDYVTTLSCTYDDLPSIFPGDPITDGVVSFDSGTRTLSFMPDFGERVTCTFTNSQGATLIVEKVAVGGDDTFNFDLSDEFNTSRRRTRTACSRWPPAVARRCRRSQS